jgi:hypothetical protein
VTVMRESRPARSTTFCLLCCLLEAQLGDEFDFVKEALL